MHRTYNSTALQVVSFVELKTINILLTIIITATADFIDSLGNGEHPMSHLAKDSKVLVRTTMFAMVNLIFVR